MLQDENNQILHRLQTSLTKASLERLSLLGHQIVDLSPLHQVLICGTHVLSRLCQFWTQFRCEKAREGPYQVSVRSLRMRLLELQLEDHKARKVREQGLKKGWEKFKEVSHYQSLLYIPEIFCTKVINQHHNNLLVGYFGIEKTRELVAQKYYWPTLRANVKTYVKGCNVCLTSKSLGHKPYGDLQSFPILTHWWKNLSMDFVTGLPVFTNWRGETYDSILVIVNQLTEIVHYESVKVTIHAPDLAEVIIEAVVRHYSLSDSIVSDHGLVFTSKFWSSLYYFLGIKRKLSTAFYSQTNGQTERQNSTMEAYLWAFVNYEQDNWAWLLPMAKFAYNNIKNASTGHTPFKLKCGYHPRASYKENINPRSQPKLADKLVTKLRELMAVCRENFQHA